VNVLSLANKRDGDRRRKSQDGPAGENSQRGSAKRKRKGEAPEIGHALRSVYDRALQEDIPREMLDLLGKLG
jgi:hypothetical protein